MTKKPDHGQCGRREVLATMAGLAGVMVAGRVARALPGRGDPDAEAVAKRLLGCLAIPLDAAQALGTLRLADHDGPADLAAVVARVAEGTGLSLSALAAASPSEIRRAVQSGVRLDFARGRTTRLHGWMLSRLETDVFEMAALLGRA